MRERLHRLRPTIINKVPKVGEPIFARVGRMRPDGITEIPLMFQKVPHMMGVRNMVPGETVELRASTVKKKNKRTFDAELYVNSYPDSHASSSSTMSLSSKHPIELTSSPFMSKEKQCIHNVEGHCNGCLFPRVAYGRQLVEKRRWIQHGWGFDPGKVMPGIQTHGSHVMEWRGYFRKGPKGWSGEGWPVACTRVTNKAKRAMGAAVDNFPEVLRYHYIKGTSDIVLFLEGGLHKADEELKRRMKETLEPLCEGVVWDGELICGKRSVAHKVTIRGTHKKRDAKKEEEKKDAEDHSSTLKKEGEREGNKETELKSCEEDDKILDLELTNAYVPSRGNLSEVTNCLLDMVRAALPSSSSSKGTKSSSEGSEGHKSIASASMRADSLETSKTSSETQEIGEPSSSCVPVVWELSGVVPFAAALGTGMGYADVVTFVDRTECIPPSFQGGLEEEEIYSAVSGAPMKRGLLPSRTALLCDLTQPRTLRRALILLGASVEQHDSVDRVRSMQDIIDDERARTYFGNDLVPQTRKLEEDLGGDSVDEKTKRRLQKLYKALAKKYHPDVAGSGDSKKFSELARAYHDLMKNEQGEVDPEDEAGKDDEVSGLLAGETLESPIVFAHNPQLSPPCLLHPSVVVWTLNPHHEKPNKVHAVMRTFLRKGLRVDTIIVVNDGPFETIRKCVLALGHQGYALEDVKALDSEPHTPNYTILARLKYRPVNMETDVVTSGMLKLAYTKRRPLSWNLKLTSGK